MTGPIKISQMSDASDTTGQDYFPVVQGGSNKRMSVPVVTSYAELRAYVSRGSKHVFLADVWHGGHFIRDDSDTTSTDNAGTVIVASNGKRWKRVVDNYLNLMWFIPATEIAGIVARTSTYDCSSALQAAVDAVAVIHPTIIPPWFKAGTTIFAPSGQYCFAAAFNIKSTITIEGVSGCFGGAATFIQGTVFKWTNNTAGFIINRFNTLDNTTLVTATFGGDETIIRNITLLGAGGLAGPYDYTKPGIWMRSRAKLENVGIATFNGDGIMIRASAGAGGDSEGNANNWRISNARIVQCAGSGLYVVGADANAGYCDMLDASNNSGYGIYDSSFLGNTYVGTHADQCALGAYKTDGVSARNTFMGCYSESGQPTGVFVLPTQLLGGIHAAGVSGGSFLDADFRGAAMKNAFQINNVIIGYNLPVPTGVVSGTGMMMGDSEGTAEWSFNRVVGRWGWQWNNLNEPAGFVYYDRAAKPANGYARDVGAATSPSASLGWAGLTAHYFGRHTQMRWRGILPTIPVAGNDYMSGDFTWKESFDENDGSIGWGCTTAGNPGTHRAMPPLLGDGGAIVQGVSKATGVTLNNRRGQITMNAANLAANTTVLFTLTNDRIGANDTVLVHRKSGGTAGAYQVACDSVAAGSCVIKVRNETAGALAEAILLQFEVQPGAIA